jgi:hypothetical protein
VFPDVVRYLVHAYDKKRPEQVGEAFQQLVTGSSNRHLPFVQYWVLAAFAEAPALCDGNIAIGLA